jgi:hypothetical protein
VNPEGFTVRGRLWRRPSTCGTTTGPSELGLWPMVPPRYTVELLPSTYGAVALWRRPATSGTTTGPLEVDLWPNSSLHCRITPQARTELWLCVSRRIRRFRIQLARTTARRRGSTETGTQRDFLNLTLSSLGGWVWFLE